MNVTMEQLIFAPKAAREWSVTMRQLNNSIKYSSMRLWWISPLTVVFWVWVMIFQAIILTALHIAVFALWIAVWAVIWATQCFAISVFIVAMLPVVVIQTIKYNNRVREAAKVEDANSYDMEQL
jgi:hypothetical protein